MKKKKLTLGSLVVILILLGIYFFLLPEPAPVPTVSLDAIPAYSGEPFDSCGVKD